MARTTDEKVSKRSHAATVALASIAMFVVLMALLVVRLEAGLDPAIAVGEHAAPATKKRVLVLERRISEQGQSSDPALPNDSGIQLPSAAPAPTTSAS